MTLTPRIARYDQVLLDLDGCVWLGDEALEGAPEAVSAADGGSGSGVALLSSDPPQAASPSTRASSSASSPRRDMGGDDRQRE